MVLRSGRLALALGALAVLGNAGCMQERPAINRVQPNYIDKMDLVPVEYNALTTTGQQPEQLNARLLAREPVFYTQTTLISKPTHGGFTGLTSYNTADKIRWEVTENFLIARQAWEYIHGAPLGGTSNIGNNPVTGDVVAVFRIESHFDIRREYNPTTGEELNVIEENAIDRPWYQRRYMHVDWSQNLIDGYNSIFEVDQWQGRIQSEPVPIYINNPEDPNRPQFAYSMHGTNRQLDYFDIVNRSILHPETTSVTYPDGTYPRLPACFLDEPADCAPAEVEMRMAFRRLDPQRDYEPAMVSNPIANAPGQQPFHLDMERFGFFDQSRVGYDRDRHTILDTQRVHWASRHNLWLYHHALFAATETATSAQGCNDDTTCAEGNTCRIGNTAHDPTHRGVCVPFSIHHLPLAAAQPGGVAGADTACQSDDDCIQASDGSGVSRTAVCDTSTHTCGEHYIRCAVDAECTTAVDPQSYCDLAIAYNRADNRGLCTMPFRQRQVRQVAYHETENYPDYMQPVTTQIVHEWNDAFHTAVRSARIRECQISAGTALGAPVDGNNPCDIPQVTGEDPMLGNAANGGGDAVFPFVGCHTPVWGTAAGDGQHSQAQVDATHAQGWDLAACGPQGTIARIGDMRYSQIGGIIDHDVQGYWGLANIASDPESGEMVVGRGAVWQTITDFYASWLTDLVKVLNGELTIDDLSAGVNFAESIQQLGSGHTPADETLDAPFRQANSLSTISLARTGLPALRLPDAGWFTRESGQTMLGTGPNHDNSALDTVRNRILNAGFLGNGTDMGTARIASLQNSGLERAMLNTQQTRIVGNLNPDDSALLSETVDRASPMRGQSVGQRHLRQSMMSELSGWQCNYDAAFSDDMLLGLAQRLHDGAPIDCANPDEATVCFGGSNGMGAPWVFNSGGNVDYALIQQYAASFIHHGVLAHEIGHSLGQRHNFTASADAVNYFDNYWKVRGQGHHLGLAPRFAYLADPMDGHFYSPQEIAGRNDEWAYSSVMDYKGLNEDAHGIGRYDYAFIANGYTNLVQAFRQVANMGLASQYATATAGNGFSTPIDLTNFGTGGALHGLHYTQIPAIFGTNAAGAPNIGDDNRYWVFLNESQITGVAGWGDPAFSNTTNDGHMLVPYRFDSDERAGLVWQDQRYDAGADGFESLHYVQERFLDYYFQNAYGRYRTGFSAGKYVSRMWSRYLDQIHQTTQIMAFDLINFGDFFSGFRSWNAFVNDPAELGGYVNLAAMSMTADTLATIVTMPEMGLHNPAVQADGQNIVAQNQLTGAGFNIAINEGRAFESNWRNEAGFFWYEQLNRAGSYYDKVMSIQAITDPELQLLGRDTPTDIRQFQLSLYTMFPAQMLRFFGGMLSEDYQDFAPIVDTAGTNAIVRPHIATINLPGAANGRVIDGRHRPIDPQDHFTIQLWAAVQTVAQFPATYDQRYMDYARLWVDGSVESVTIADPTNNTVSFTDPWTHETYRALHISTVAGASGADVGSSALLHAATGAVADEAGIAARMLLHVADLDHQRTAGATTAIQTTAEAAEHQYIDLIQIMRNLTQQFGQGQYDLPSAHGS